MSKIEDGEYYIIILHEVNRHLEDTEVSKLSHFYAASVYEKRNKYYLGLPTTLSALVLAWLVSKDAATIGSNSYLVSVLKISLSLIVPILSGLVTFLNFNETASKHRTAAQRYHQLWRRCKNWKTDFPDETTNDKAKEIVIKYREELNDINSQSPQIPKWAWKNTQKQQDEGSTRYDTNNSVDSN